MDAELAETVNDLYEQADAMARELNLRNEAMARTENVMRSVMDILRTIRQSEDGLIFIEEREIERIGEFLEFVRRINRPSKLTPIAQAKKSRKRSNVEVQPPPKAVGCNAVLGAERPGKG